MRAIKTVLFMVPFIWSVFLVPLANRETPYILGLPFLAFWELTGVVLVSVCIALLYYLDEKAEKQA